MLEEQHKKIFRRLIEEGFNQGKLEVLDELLAPHFSQPEAGCGPSTGQRIKETIQSVRTTFPDLTLTIEEILANGDRLWVRLSGRVTPGGPYAGRPSLSQPLVMTVIDRCRFEKGKIVEHSGIVDRLSSMMQLGSFPQ